MTDKERLHNLVRHIHGVQESCYLLAEKLMDRGEFLFAKRLMAKGFSHDNSKFFGCEWEYLSIEPEVHDLKIAVTNHSTTNDHHPEAWDKGIHGMPRICVAEMVCDWKTRSAERGTSLRDWVNGEAMKRFSFTRNDAVYETIMDFINLLLDPPLKNIKEL